MTRLCRRMTPSGPRLRGKPLADIYDIDVIFVEERETHPNPLGVKGLGEIGIVGTAAAIANAVFHATGVRVRNLPITIDKLLGLRREG